MSRHIGPVHRSILAIDVENATARTNPIKLALRHQIYRFLGAAMTVAGINQQYCEPLTDRGDGVLALIHPVDEVPRFRLINPLIPELTRLLGEYNAGLPPAEQVSRELRLRAVVHAGDVLRDDYGPFGTELDIAFRLLDAEAVKNCLRETPSPLVLVVSEQIYESIVLHRYDGICPESYRRAVRIVVCGLRRYGWVHVPDDSMSKEQSQTLRTLERPLEDSAA